MPDSSSHSPAKIEPGENQLYLEFFETAREEIALRRQQAELQKLAQTDGHEFAKLALEAQRVDRQEQRQYFERKTSRSQIFIGCIFVVICAFLLALVAMNQPALVSELVKAAVFLLSGGAGGYAYGTQKANKRGQKNQQTD